MNDPLHTNSDPDSGIPASYGHSLLWWAMLLVAVLAVPAISLTVAAMLPIGDFGRLIVFIVTCWVSVWIGMWLMKQSKTPIISTETTKISDE